MKSAFPLSLRIHPPKVGLNQITTEFKNDAVGFVLYLPRSMLKELRHVIFGAQFAR